MVAFNLVNASMLIGSQEETYHRPLAIWNVLTGEVRGYDTVDALLNGAAYFDFVLLPPSIYSVKNFTGTPLTVVLFGAKYTVEGGTEWRFVAHDEIAAHRDTIRLDASLGLMVRSYWDTLLGGSIWDGGDSIWDAYSTGGGTSGGVPA